MQIDHVYLLNLPHRTDRLEESRKQLKEYDFEVIPAVKHESGVIGLKMTLSNVFDNAIQNGYENILIFEDDVKVLQPRKVVEKALKELPEQWDTLFLGGNVYKQPLRFSNNLLKLTEAVANHAVLYNSKVFPMLYALYCMNEGNNVPSDVLLNQHIIQRRGKSFITKTIVATQMPGYSDIENKVINYDEFLINRFVRNTAGL